jgi:hypothetical protein
MEIHVMNDLLTRDRVFLKFRSLRIHDLRCRNEDHKLYRILIMRDRDRDNFRHRTYGLLHHFL